uniref:2-oxoglutarate reductase n=2 Tax=Arcella intermedia TaxID=1963864 RepID=A0A6B2L5Q4_9EUKA
MKKQPIKTNILLLENIAQSAVDLLVEQGFHVETAAAISDEQLKEKLKNYHAVGIRSKTTLSKEILEEASKKLLCIGCFCIGTDRVDLPVAQKLGIPVFNSPYQNSRSVAELIIANIISLGRHLGDRNMEVHKGIWNKTAKGCIEIRGKVLGIVGYGHIGSQLSVLAESVGMEVKFYDIEDVMALGNSKRIRKLDELLAIADFVTLHVPDTPQTKNMITEREIGLMKRGSFLLNASRGTVVDVEALAAALKSGHLGGAYVDVFPSEPNGHAKDFVSPLQGCPNTILSPHIGGSTTEAQEAIGREVASRFIAYLETGSTTGAVNFPNIALPYAVGTHRILNIHKNTPGVLKAINNILSVYNVESQVLRTQGSIGYLIADVSAETSSQIKTEIAALPTSIKTRT